MDRPSWGGVPSGDRRPPNQDRSRQAPRNLAYHLRKETSQRWPGKHSARAVKRAALQSARGRVAGSSRGAGWTPRGCAAGQSSAETCSPDATGRGRSSGTLRPWRRLSAGGFPAPFLWPPGCHRAWGGHRPHRGHGGGLCPGTRPLPGRGPSPPRSTGRGPRPPAPACAPRTYRSACAGGP